MSVLVKNACLLEDLQHTCKLVLDEEQKKSGRYVVRGIFAVCDVVTGNNRIYPAYIMDKAIAEILPSVKERKVFGHLDHPQDAATKLSLASHIITDLRIEEQGGRKVILGEAEILDNEHGRQLLSIIKAGGQVGVSSRGVGSVEKDDKGVDVVQEDFKLKSFDFVAEPANYEAYPQFFMESKNKILGDSDMEKMTLAEFKQKFPAAYNEIMQECDKWKEAIKESIERKLKNDILYTLAKERKILESKVKEEQKLNSDLLGADKVLKGIVGLLKGYLNASGNIDVSSEVRKELESIKEELSIKDKDLKEAEEFIKDLGKRYMMAKYVDSNPKASELRAKLESIEFKDFNQFKSEIDRVLKECGCEVETEPVSEKEVEDLKKRIREKIKKLLADKSAYGEAEKDKARPLYGKDEIEKSEDEISDLKRRIRERIKKLEVGEAEGDSIEEDAVSELKKRIRERIRKYKGGKEEPVEESEISELRKRIRERLKKRVSEQEKPPLGPFSDDTDEEDEEEEGIDLVGRLKRRIGQKEDVGNKGEDIKEVELYLIKQTEMHPAKFKIRQLFKEGKIRTKKDVDLICEALKGSSPRVIVESRAADEVNDVSNVSSDILKDWGLSVEEYKKLSGMQ